MDSRGITLSVVMDGRDGSATAREYAASDGDTYIEGREGSAFRILVRNRTGGRVCVLPSVDGLSVMDGSPAGDSSGGYVLEAGGRVEIPGWRRGKDAVARFEFSDVKDGVDGSYVAKLGGEAAHKGVIGLTVVAERPRVRPARPYRTDEIDFLDRIGERRKGRMTLSASSSSLSASSATSGMSGVLRSSAHEDTSSLEASAQSLGTAYGREERFETSRSDFVRGDVMFRMALFYDDERGLKRRGIDVRRPLRAKPNPFPANETGCPAPAGWEPGR